MSRLAQTSAQRRVGVVGAGQLARMMGEVATYQGAHLTVLADSPEDAAVATSDAVVLGAATDRVALAALAANVDVVTFDHELVDLDQILELEARGVLVRPSAHALRFAVDKGFQRVAFAAAGLPVPSFLVVNAVTDDRLTSFLDALGAPPVLKSARGGYDGRGVLFPRDRRETLALLEGLRGDVVVEERLDLRSEVAQLVVRGLDGDVALYPLVTTVQSEGMCVEVRYPAEVDEELHREAAALARRLATLIDVVGTLAVEFFVTEHGLVINEVALRPHNSGHWTIEGTSTSQFANHLRAVSGQPLGAIEPAATHVVMVNVVGAEQPGDVAAARAISGAHVHDYGKSWRPGRKLGHVTALGGDAHSAHVTAWAGARAFGTRTREA